MSSQRYRDIFGDGGPSDRSLLKRQEVHRSQAIWNAEISGSKDEFDVNAIFKIYRRRWKQKPVEHMAFLGYMQDAGFLDVWRIGHVVIEPALITALVERWRPETHTFHMPVGEMTIMLQDVAVLYGLPIDGLPLTGQQTPTEWEELCIQCFSRNPKDTPGYVVSNGIALRWFEEFYDPANLDEDVDDYTVRQYVRASIMRLIGCVLFAETTEFRVSVCWLPMLVDCGSIGRYSWGSACLAHLYNQLCRATDQNCFSVAGDLALLCMWAAERIIPLQPVIKNPIVPEYGQALGIRWAGKINRRESRKCTIVKLYRRELDELKDEDVIWLPYSDAIIGSLPPLVHRDRRLWLACVPLIAFWCMEWHYPDRVFRQFGYVQGIPHPPEPDDGTHSTHLGGRGQTSTKWDEVFAYHVNLWKDLRYNYVFAPGLRIEHGNVHYYDKYMNWYRLHLRRFISHVGATALRNADAVEHICYASQDDPHIQTLSEAALQFVGEERCYTEMPQYQQPPPQYQAMVYNVPESERMLIARRKQNMFSRRKKMPVGTPEPLVAVQPMQWSDYQGQVSQTQMLMQELHLSPPSFTPMRPHSPTLRQGSVFDIGVSSSFIPHQTLLQPLQSGGFTGGLFGEQIGSHPFFTSECPMFSSPRLPQQTLFGQTDFAISPFQQQPPSNTGFVPMQSHPIRLQPHMHVNASGSIRQHVSAPETNTHSGSEFDESRTGTEEGPAYEEREEARGIRIQPVRPAKDEGIDCGTGCRLRPTGKDKVVVQYERKRVSKKDKAAKKK